MYIRKYLSDKTLRPGYEAIDEADLEKIQLLQSKSMIKTNEERHHDFKSKKSTQYLAALTVSMGFFSNGAMEGWSSPALPNMEHQYDFHNFKSDSSTATWISAITFIGCMCSSFVTGYLLQRVGRKWTMVAEGAIFVLGWLTIALAPDIEWILLGRFVTGFCGAGASLTALIYVGEISEAHVRGMLCNALSLAGGLGVLFTCTVGSFVSWRTLSLICGLMPAIFTVGVIFLPESPYFLLTIGKLEETFEVLMWFRGATSDVHVMDEFISKKNSVHYRKQAPRSDLLKSSVLKPFGICMMVVIFDRFGGMDGVMSYFVTLFEYADINLSANLAAIILASVQVIALGASTQTVDRGGRKISFMVSEIGMSVSLFALGVFFYLKAHNVDVQLGWLPLTSLTIYVLSYNMGVGPVTWTLMSELLSPSTIGITSSILAGFSHGLGFIVTKFFMNMVDVFTFYGCSWFFVAVSLCGFVFCLRFVPETKGKTKQDIQNYFR